MPIKYSFFALALFIASCGKEAIVKPPVEETGKDIEKNIVNTNTLSKIDIGLKDRTIQNAGFSLLGYGFDAKENSIFMARALRSKVVNIETVPENRVDVLNARASEGFSSTNLTKSEVLALLKLSNTNPIKPAYLDDELQKTLPNDSISFVKQMVKDRILRLYSSGLKPTNYSMDFNRAIADLTPSEIVKKFGTHVLADFYQGFSYILLRFKDKETYTDNTITRNWQQLVFATGADVSKITLTDKGVDFGAYARSFTPDNSQFVGFNDLNQQIPIYELLEKGDQREALKKYIESYLR